VTLFGVAFAALCLGGIATGIAGRVTGGIAHSVASRVAGRTVATRDFGRPAVLLTTNKCARSEDGERRSDLLEICHCCVFSCPIREWARIGWTSARAM